MALVNDIVNETVEKLNSLAKKKRKLDKEGITNKIKEIMSDAFKQTGSNADKNSLYKNLARKLHSDHLKTNKKLYDYLVANEITDLPMTTLGEAYLEKNEFTPDALTTAVISIFKSTLNALLRYPVVIRELTLFMFVVVFVGVLVSMVIALIPIVIINSVISLVLSTPERFLLNLITQNKYDEVISEGNFKIDGAKSYLIKRGVNAEEMNDDEILGEFKTATLTEIALTIKTELLLSLRDRYRLQNIDTTMMNDDELQADNEQQLIALDLIEPLKLETVALVQYKYDQQIAHGEPAKTPDEIIEDALNTIETNNKNANNQGFTHIKLVFDGFIRTLGRPWPAGIVGKTGSFFVRLPQFISAVIWVPIAFAIEIVKFSTVELPAILIIALSFMAILVTTVILASPVFAWDGFNSFFNQPEEDDDTEEDEVDEQLNDDRSIEQRTADLIREMNQSSRMMSEKMGARSPTNPLQFNEADAAQQHGPLFKSIDAHEIDNNTHLNPRSPSPGGRIEDID